MVSNDLVLVKKYLNNFLLPKLVKHVFIDPWLDFNTKTNNQMVSNLLTKGLVFPNDDQDFLTNYSGNIYRGTRDFHNIYTQVKQ